MNYLSVCSGIEAASQAWADLGWTPVAFSEIESAPCRVLAHHYPNVPNWGDMKKFKEWPDATVNVLCGGTPCQSFSNAGDRAGLDDPRGHLMLTYGAIAARYRPEWLVWENVPGVLSSNEGRDFASLLGLLSGQRIEPPEGGWQSAGFVAGHPNAYGLAWRVLDAQFVRVDSHPRAVPQRRNRVFVVGHLGDWRRAAAVLLERESLRGDPAPSREAGKGSAARALCSTDGGVDREDRHTLIAQGFDTYNQSLTGDTTQTLCSRGDSPGGNAHLVPAVLAYGGNNTAGSIDVATARNACSSASGRMDFESETFIAVEPGRGAAVRRLTPAECLRLQGMADDYLDIEVNGKPLADGPKYKAIGNSWALNCARWVGERIAMVDAIGKK